MVKDIKENVAIKIRMLIADDNDDDKALLGIKERLKGAMIVPRIITIQLFPHPLLPAPLTNNNSVPHTLQYGQ